MSNAALANSDARFLIRTLPVVFRPLANIGQPIHILFAPGPGLGLGDQCMCVPLVEALWEKFNSAHVTIFTNSPDVWRQLGDSRLSVKELSQHTSVIELITSFDLSILGYFPDILEKLSQSTSHVIFAAGDELTKLRCFYSHSSECREVPLTACKLAVSEHQKFLALFHDLGIDSLAKVPYVTKMGLRNPNVKDSKGHRILLHPCAAKSYKEWPIARWRDLAHDLIVEGKDVAVSSGTNSREYNVAHMICDAVPGVTLVRQEPLHRFVDLLDKFDLVISGDTGISHVAAFYGSTVSLSIYGPTDPIRFCPPCSNCFFISPYPVTRTEARNGVIACLQLISNKLDALTDYGCTEMLLRTAERLYSLIQESDRWARSLSAGHEFELLAREFAGLVSTEYQDFLMGSSVQLARIRFLLQSQQCSVAHQYLRQSSMFRSARWIAAYAESI